MNQFKDTDLREALRRKYSDTPQLPSDFMASMKQRMEADVHEDQKPAATIRRWRWMAAAACLLFIIGIGFTLWPKHEAQTIQPQVAQKIEQPQTEQPKSIEPQTAESETIETETVNEPQAEPAKMRTSVAKAAPKNELAKAETATEPKEEIIPDTPPAPETDMAETLTERDIPITRPENYKYTAEELALLKKQASEAYLKWVELELEISRYTLEQTAQK
jgi:hypothetical protein